MIFFSSILIRLYHFYEVLTRRSSYPILFRGCDREKTGTLYRAISSSLLLAIVLTSCAKPSILTKYKGVEEGKEVFHDIAQKITTSKKRTIAIIDFSNKDGEMIKEGENVAKNMAMALNQEIGIERVWIESGKSLMNALEKNRIIQNGKIVNKELAKKLWQKMGIEAVITGVLDPHLNGIGFSIELHDVQDDKVIHRYKGTWQQEDAIAMRGSQSSESTGTSRDVWTPPTPSDYKEISQHFLNSHKHATLADVGNALQTALKNAGFKTTYLPVPEGFALVSNDVDFQFFIDGNPISPNATIVSKTLYLLKAIKENPLTIPEVWISGLSKQALDSSEQIFHKVVCVIVTPGDPSWQGQMTLGEAQNLITLGGATIPETLRTKQYIEGQYRSWALLYAFEKDSSGDKIRFVPLGDERIHIRDHLQQTGFWDNL